MKKIALISISKPTLSGGPSMIYNILNKLDKEKFEICLIGQYECPLTELAREKEITVHIIKARMSNRKIFGTKILNNILVAGNSILNSIKYYKILSKQNYDLIWCENIHALFLISLFKFKKTNIIYNMWSTVNSKLGLNLINKLADHIVVESEFQKNMFSNITKNNKISRVYTQIDSSVFCEKTSKAEAKTHLGFKEKEIVIGFLGGARYYKGYDLFLKAAHKIIFEYKLSNISFVAGGITPTDDLINNIETNNMINDLGNKFKTLHWINNKESFYRGIDIYISMSRSEGLPGTIREAMGFGVPTIGTNVGATSEVIGDFGYLIDGHSDNEVTNECIKYILKIISNFDYSEEQARTGQEYIGKMFIGDDWVNRLGLIFETLVNKRRNS